MLQDKVVIRFRQRKRSARAITQEVVHTLRGLATLSVADDEKPTPNFIINCRLFLFLLLGGRPSDLGLRKGDPSAGIKYQVV
jgi:hypothetical protein